MTGKVCHDPERAQIDRTPSLCGQARLSSAKSCSITASPAATSASAGYRIMKTANRPTNPKRNHRLTGPCFWQVRPSAKSCSTTASPPSTLASAGFPTNQEELIDRLTSRLTTRLRANPISSDRRNHCPHKAAQLLHRLLLPRLWLAPLQMKKS